MYSTPVDTASRAASGRRGGRRRREYGPSDFTAPDGVVAAHGEPPRRGRGRGPRDDGFGFGPGGFGPGGFGPGGFGPRGFGPGGFGPGGRGRHGGRGRGPRRGDVRLAILRLLAEEPMHGYQIITELTERSQGAWRPSPGSVYPTLQALADQGLVTSEETEGRRVFSLSDAGRAEVTAAEQAGTPAPWAAIADSVDERVHILRSRLGQVMSATRQVGQFGTADQVTRAGEVLADARRALYGLLAEDEPASGGPADDPASGEEPSPES